MIVVVSINNHIVSTYDQIEEIFGVANVALKVFHNTNYAISTSNHMFGRAIWDKLPVCIFENFFKNHEGDLSQKWPEPNMWLLVNHTKPTNTLHWTNIF